MCANFNQTLSVSAASWALTADLSDSPCVFCNGHLLILGYGLSVILACQPSMAMAQCTGIILHGKHNGGI
jgi:hypothetical protein